MGEADAITDMSLRDSFLGNVEAIVGILAAHAELWDRR